MTPVFREWSDGGPDVYVESSGQYATPEGFFDVPFAYTYDADALTSAGNYYDLSLQLGDGEFHLRRICGIQQATLAERFRLHTPFRSLYSHPSNSQIMEIFDGFIAPEQVYPPGGVIVFDVENAVALGATEHRFITFFGVKRYPGKPNKTSERAGPYFLRPFVYVVAVGAPWAVNTLRPFLQRVGSYDFELYRFTQINYAAVPNIEGEVGFWAMSLYDAYGARCNPPTQPVHDNHMLDSPIQTPGIGSQQEPGPWPFPALCYPAGSIIQMELTSTYQVSADNLELCLHGAERIPCEAV